MAEDFEARLDKAKLILQKLLDSDITMSESVKAYAEGMKELQSAQKLLEEAVLHVETIKQSPQDSAE
jgi:exodeoxyribonuclease VII small subunit